MATFTSNSAVETEEFGHEVGSQLRPGDILALVGELGSGKTQLAKGVVRALGSSATVTSPTFTLVHEYGGGRLPIYHFDFFRIDGSRSAERVGLDDYFFGDGVSIIEWADKFPHLIPSHATWITFEMESATQRVLTISENRPALQRWE